MSKLFWDHLIAFETLELDIKQVINDPEELDEMRNLIDEILHHRILGIIFDHLPEEHHEEFLNLFHEAPFDTNLINYINEKSGKDIEAVIKMEADLILTELTGDIKKR